MDGLVQIGDAPWSYDTIKSKLDEFVTIYPNRPIKDNAGGMRAPHMFGAWFMLSQLQPEHIIESGVYRGGGTWILEKACPNARLHCIDPMFWKKKEYTSPNASYNTKDFAKTDWSKLPKDKTVAFFDDHQNAVNRVKALKAAGFKHAIFEDNYTPGQGDFYTLKQAFAEAGYVPDNPVKRKFPANLIYKKNTNITPNKEDAQFLRDTLDVYFEFPPLVPIPNMISGKPWDERYPTQQPVFENIDEVAQQHPVLKDELQFYNSMCYVRLK